MFKTEAKETILFGGNLCTHARQLYPAQFCQSQFQTEPVLWKRKSCQCLNRLGFRGNTALFYFGLFRNLAVTIKRNATHMDGHLHYEISNFMDT